MDPSTGSLILEWDRPMNCETGQDVTAYDIRFKPCTCLEKKGYCMMTVKAPARNILLTRESGLKPLKNYEFEVRARNTGYEGNWSGILEHIGMSICVFLSMFRPVCMYYAPSGEKKPREERKGHTSSVYTVA